jgi:hypothetical protein
VPAGGIAVARICCAIPPWKAQSLDNLRLKATVQFVGKCSLDTSTSLMVFLHFRVIILTFV